MTCISSQPRPAVNNPQVCTCNCKYSKKNTHLPNHTKREFSPYTVFLYRFYNVVLDMSNKSCYNGYITWNTLNKISTKESIGQRDRSISGLRFTNIFPQGTGINKMFFFLLFSSQIRDPQRYLSWNIAPNYLKEISLPPTYVETLPQSKSFSTQCVHNGSPTSQIVNTITYCKFSN